MTMNFTLPQYQGLPVQLLAATFKKTAATYKFYWFLSLLQLIEEEGTKIEKRKIFARMLSNAWYPINYFKLSFGKQDKIQEAISFFHHQRGIPIDLDRQRVWKSIMAFNDPTSLAWLIHFDKQVPHWFISPWFPSRNSPKQIYNQSTEREIKSPYFLARDYIEINPEWLEYLLRNSAILKDFCYWNLSLFLQKHNPNVPDIPNKLVKPARRGSLENHKKGFWNFYFDEVHEQRCIYSGSLLIKLFA